VSGLKGRKAGSNRTIDATIDPARAGLDCRAQVKIKTDGPIRIRLAGCQRVISAR
jgi:hypothetical protein